MGLPVVSQIIKSGALLYEAPVGEAIPSETTVAWGAAWGGNWKRVGFTKAPLSMLYDSEEFDIDVEEELAAVDRVRVKEKATLETVLAELTAEYLQLAAGNQDTVSTTAAGAAQKAFEETSLGGEPILTKKQYGFEGRFITTGGDDEPIRAFIHKATAKLNGPLEFSKKSTEYTGVSIQIAALTDTTQSVGQKLVKFQRITSEVT